MFGEKAPTSAPRAGSGHRGRAVCALLAALALLAAHRADPAESPGAAAILDTLNSVHSFGEVALSPDGRHLVYGNVATGKRGGADVDISALWIVNAKDGGAAVRLTACPEGHFFFKRQDQLDAMSRVVDWFDRYLSP